MFPGPLGSLFYLRHWLVQRVADGTIIGADTPPGASVAFHFLRNLVLRALGANVALTSLISTRVVAFDLVSVGHLASVNSTNLAAISFGERKMVLKSISVGDGAFVGSKSVLEPGCELAPGAHVAGLSLVPCGRVSGHLSGVPVAVVGAPRSLPSDEVVRNFRTKRGSWPSLSFGSWQCRRHSSPASQSWSFTWRRMPQKVQKARNAKKETTLIPYHKTSSIFCLTCHCGALLLLFSWWSSSCSQLC